MIPAIFLQRSNFFEFWIYQIIQTIFDFILVEVLLFLGLLIILRDRNQIEFKNMIISGLVIETIYIIYTFFLNLIIFFGPVIIVIHIASSLITQFIVLYLRYFEKNRIGEIKIAFLFILIIIPALLISVVITSSIFILAGLSDPFLNILM